LSFWQICPNRFFKKISKPESKPSRQFIKSRKGMYQLWFLLAIGKKYIFKWSPVIYGKSYHIEENYGCIQIRHHRPYLRTLLPTCSPYNCGSKWYLLLLMLQPLKHQPRCLQWSMCLIHLLLFSCTNDKQRWDRFVTLVQIIKPLNIQKFSEAGSTGFVKSCS